MEGKKLLLEKSGMPALRVELDAALARVPKARAHESALLFAGIREALEHASRRAGKVVRGSKRRRCEKQRLDFDRGLKTVIEKVSGDIDVMLNALGADNAARA